MASQWRSLYPPRAARSSPFPSRFYRSPPLPARPLFFPLFIWISLILSATPRAPLSVLPPFSNVLYLRSGFSSPLFAHPTPPFFLLSLSLSVTLFPSLFSPLPFVRHLPPSRTRATVLSHVQVTLISCATNLADQNWILTITAWSRRYSLYRCVVYTRCRALDLDEKPFSVPLPLPLSLTLFSILYHRQRR